MSVEMVKCKLNGQFDIVLPKHRADRPEWYTEKGWERKRLDSMSKNIGEGDIVLYIEADSGHSPTASPLRLYIPYRPSTKLSELSAPQKPE